MVKQDVKSSFSWKSQLDERGKRIFNIYSDLFKKEELFAEAIVRATRSLEGLDVSEDTLLKVATVWYTFGYPTAKHYVNDLTTTLHNEPEKFDEKFNEILSKNMYLNKVYSQVENRKKVMDTLSTIPMKLKLKTHQSTSSNTKKQPDNIQTKDVSEEQTTPKPTKQQPTQSQSTNNKITTQTKAKPIYWEQLLSEKGRVLLDQMYPLVEESYPDIPNIKEKLAEAIVRASNHTIIKSLKKENLISDDEYDKLVSSIALVWFTFGYNEKGKNLVDDLLLEYVAKGYSVFQQRLLSVLPNDTLYSSIIQHTTPTEQTTTNTPTDTLSTDISVEQNLQTPQSNLELPETTLTTGVDEITDTSSVDSLQAPSDSTVSLTKEMYENLLLKRSDSLDKLKDVFTEIPNWISSGSMILKYDEKANGVVFVKDKYQTTIKDPVTLWLMRQYLLASGVSQDSIQPIDNYLSSLDIQGVSYYDVFNEISQKKETLEIKIITSEAQHAILQFNVGDVSINLQLTTDKEKARDQLKFMHDMIGLLELEYSQDPSISSYITTLKRFTKLQENIISQLDKPYRW